MAHPPPDDRPPRRRHAPAAHAAAACRLGHHPDEAARALHRALEIHRALARGQAPSKQDLAERFGVTPKTIQRDIRALRDEGAPIAYDRHRQGYVATRPGWTFAGFRLDPAEQFALMVAENAVAQYEGTAIHATLAQAFERLIGEQSALMRSNHSYVSEAIHFGGLPPPAIDPLVWTELLSAVQSREVVRLRYAALGREPDWRVVHPYQLLVRDRDWFLVAHRPDRREERLYYLPRVRQALPTGETFHRRPGFDVERFHAQSFNAMQGPARPVWVELRFAPEVAQLVTERRWAPDQVERRHADGSVSVRFRSAALFEIGRQVLRYEGRVQLVRPLGLRRQIATAARRLARLHRA